ncbi:MAG: hypothetical protein ACI4PG_08900 [Candidatus Ventricola sp.]
MSTDSMEEIYSQLRQLQNELAAQSSAVRALADSVDEMSGGDLKLRMNLRLACGGGVSGSDVKSVLGSLNRTLGACGDQSGRLRQAVSSVESLFRDNERQIIASLGRRSDGMMSFAGRAPVLAGAGMGAVTATQSAGVDRQPADQSPRRQRAKA